MKATLPFLIVLLMGGAGFAKDFRVANFGAAGDGISDDGPAIRKAVAELTQAKDAEAAACIGVSLAVATGKGLPAQVNPPGISILKHLPNHQGRDMAKGLYNSCADDDVKRRLKEVLEE